MSDSSHLSADAAARFFDNYLTLLNKNKVPEKQRRWYVRHVETFIRSQKGRKIKALSGTEVDAYLDMLGRQNRLNGWQFAQHIDAIRILYCDLLATDVCQTVDWQYRLDSARVLETDHPTLARQLTPEELSYIKERKGEGPLNQVRAAHRDLLVQLTSEIRRRGYAYRTEQTYERRSCVTRCATTQVSQCRARVEVAISFSIGALGH